jgi:hypothetical protein
VRRKTAIILALCAAALAGTAIRAAMWSPPVSEQITVSLTIPLITFAAGIDFDPDTLEKDSEGVPVTVYIDTPPETPVTWIKIHTVLLNDTAAVLAEPPPVIADFDEDGQDELMVKFDRYQVSSILPLGRHLVTVTGQLAGHRFSGQDTVRVMKRPKEK